MGGGVMQSAPAKEGSAASIPVPGTAPAGTDSQKPAPQQIPK